MAGETEGRVLALPGGKSAGLLETGDPAGFPVFLMHGMPGSRLSGFVFDEPGRTVGARILAIDRPGYGLTPPIRAEGVLAAAEQIRAVAHELRLSRFSVIGVSGGTSYAVACAAAMPESVSGLVLMSAMGSLRAPGAMEGMVGANRIMFSLGRLSPRFIGWLLPIMLRASLPKVEAQLASGNLPVSDVPADVFAALLKDQREAVRQGGAGVRFDMSNLWKPWNFEISKLRAPAALWQGNEDNLAPVGQAKALAQQIPGCQVHLVPGGHTGTFVFAQDALTFLKEHG